MDISNEIMARIEARGRQLETAVKAGVDSGLIDWPYYQDSETQLIELMGGDPPAPNAPGSIEFGWVLYVANNDLPTWLTHLLKLLGLPASKITASDWNSWDTILSGEGALAGDGSLASYAYYAMVDPGWVVALMDYLLLKIGYIKLAPFATDPATLEPGSPDSLSIALFGDWGTGVYKDGNLLASPSQLVIRQVTDLAPDISIHLGDVYYAGTVTEEQNNLLSHWYQASVGNFTLNSNHEMYDGANGYFGAALADSIFSGQQKTSYFSIEFGNWVIFGLDSAYYDTSSMYMEGALTDPNQLKFIKNTDISGKKVLVLTHHTGLDPIGSTTTGLWTDVVNALGRQPDYWYWGHEHNGIVYGDLNGTISTQCRCLGNGAIPIGDASWFSNPKYNGNIEFYTNTPLSNPTPQQKLRVMNGFAVLTFTLDASTGDYDIAEQWYNQDGSKAWNS